MENLHSLVHGHLDHHKFDHSHQNHADDHLDFKIRKKIRNTRHRKKFTANNVHGLVLHLFDHEHGPDAIMHHAMPKQSRAIVSQMKVWVQRSFVKTKVAVLVSDLSGFTSTTRKYGIVHFASIIIRMRQLCLPILHHYNALHIGTEADNLIVVFSSAIGAARAAYEMQHVLSAYRYSLDADRSHFKVDLNGIGLAYGTGVIVDREGKLHGETANAAYHIGEDLCEHGSIVMTKDVVDAIKDHSAFADATFVDFQSSKLNVSTTMGPVFSLQGHVDYVHNLTDTTDMTYLNPDLELLCRRHRKGADLTKIDSLIQQKFMKKMTAIMFDIDYSEIERVEGAEAGLIQKFKSYEMLKPILEQHNAITLEDVLHVFEDSVDAVKCCTAMQARIRKHNKGLPDHAKLKLSGFGAHKGNMIFIRGTDVHWGDPVNTSSKLGQDVAVNGEILITTPVYKSIERNPDFQGVQFIPRKFTKSGVEFTCYAVHPSFVRGQSKRPAHPAMDNADLVTDSFSVGTQCNFDSISAPGYRRPQGIKPKSGIFGLPSGAQNMQRFPSQLLDQQSQSIGKVLVHNMTSSEPLYTLRPKPDANVPYQRPSYMTDTTEMRRKAEYERTTKQGMGQLGQSGDAIMLHPGVSGGHPVMTSPKKRRNDQSRDVTTGIGNRILHLGVEDAPLQTTKRVMTQSNYNPVLGKYPARLPYAGNSVNPRASNNFLAEAKRRTGPEKLTGSRPMRLIRDRNAGGVESVGANLNQYGTLPAPKIKTRTDLAKEHGSGRGVVETFKQMEQWSEDVYMPNPPIQRFDGSGRTVSPRKRQTYNRILQKEYNADAEAALQKKEMEEQNATKAKRLATGYNRQASYNIISVRDRQTGEEIFTPEAIKRGVKHVATANGGSGSVSGLLGARMPYRQKHDANHPAVRYGAEDKSHMRGGTHVYEEAMANQRMQITGANNLGKLVRYENDGIINHEASRQYEESGFTN